MNLTDVVIPEGVTSVGKLAFAFCHKLTNVVLPASLVSIERQAFADCRSLSSITIPEGVTLTRDEVMDELAADFAGDMLDDADLFAKFSKENRTAAQKLLDSLKEFLNKVRGLFTGKYRDMAAQEAYGKDFAELEDIAKQWQAAFDAAERKAEKTKTAAGEGEGAKYQIKQFPNGMKYVQADRRVLFGNDPKAWSERLESYINDKIRNHEDVRLIAEDGDVLLLTSKSAGKLSSIYDNNGRTLDEKAFERKANAATHVDELIKVSARGGKTVLDFGGRHGDMAKDGWNYRTAYFMDFDGKYYRTRISVALGKDGSIVSISGKCKKEALPKLTALPETPALSGGMLLVPVYSPMARMSSRSFR